MTRLVVFYNLFVAGMLLVVLANDALFFLVAWELMAAASYFLVVFEDDRVENRRAGFLYLVVAHVGAVAILLSFGILAGLGTGFTSFAGYSYNAMRQASLPGRWAAAAFLLSESDPTGMAEGFRMSRARTAFMMFSMVFTLAVGMLPAPAQEPAESASWRTFEASWSSTGQVQTIPTEGEPPAAIVRLSGAVVVTGASGLSQGFQGEVIGFDDGGTTSTGRSVWTDEHGDQIFSALKGEAPQTGRHVVGTITGGSGRYAGGTGEYEFTWQYVVRVDDGTIQGRAVGLKGRVRRVEGSQ